MIQTVTDVKAIKEKITIRGAEEKSRSNVFAHVSPITDKQTLITVAITDTIA